MADFFNTVTNARGDVVLYIRHEDKHTLVTFDAATNGSYTETLVQTETGVWAYLAVKDEGPIHFVLPAKVGADTVDSWAETQGFADWLMEEF